MLLEQYQRDYIQNCKLEAERKRERLGLAWVLESSKSTPNDIPLPIRPHLLILSKQFHQLDQVFKHMSL